VVVVVVVVGVAVVVAPETFGDAAKAAGPLRATLMITGTATAATARAVLRKTRRSLSTPASGSTESSGERLVMSRLISVEGEHAENPRRELEENCSVRADPVET
jgi:hypothetical protein